MKHIARNRIYYGLFIGITIILGLLSRTKLTPNFIYPYLGDMLYALLIYLITAAILYKKTSQTIFGIATIFCFAIEISQLYQGVWINTVRDSRIGSLILGHGFLWSDLVAYCIGTGIGLLAELGIKKRKALT